ncbi:MAG: hypothetical protein CMH64_00250 [Nanoarchaeota archaeon]|nr:hypothetical protein [Nanoarchaeota archaeon]|tara:strand:- start:4604 stop:5809 length:1206 start_codon:yes stop_codon:yes gene_type:complete
MTNVLVTATTFPRWKGDPEPGFVYFLSNLLGKKHAVNVLVPHFSKIKKIERMGEVNVYRFPYFFEKFQRVCYDGGILPNLKKYFSAKIGLPFLVFFGFMNTIKMIKKKDIKLVHAHWILPQGLIATIMKKLYGIPFLVTVHGGDIFPFRKKPLFRKLIKYVLKNCDYCTVNSSATKEAILEICNVKRIEVIPMGVDLKSFSSSKKDDALKKEMGIEKDFLLTVGRLASYKGIKYLITALVKIKEDFPKIKLIIVGDGPEKEYLEKLTRQLNLEENIIFTGKIPNENLPRYYASADIFIGPSIIAEDGWTEGMGIVFLESISSGTPVIGSDVGGISDIIKDNETGLLVEQKNSEQIANAVGKILKDKKIGEKMVKKGKKYVEENYSWDVVAERFEKIYGELI